MSPARNNQVPSALRSCARTEANRAAGVHSARLSAVACMLALFAMVGPTVAHSQSLRGVPTASAEIGDVRLIAGQLRRLGLRVEVREITDFSGRRRAFLDFGAKAEHTAGTFYYGSRGVQLDEANGAIAVQLPNFLPVDAVGLSGLLSQIRQAAGQIRVMALNTCADEAAGHRLRSSISHCLAFVIVPADAPVSPTAYANGLLHIRVEPSGAKVRIDGSDYGNGPQVQASLPAGLHRIVVSDGDTAATVRDIRVTPGAVSDVQMILANRRFASAMQILLPPP